MAKKKKKILTPFQEQFCRNYVKTSNGSQSYKDAYGTDKDTTSRKNSHQLLQRDYIQQRIRELQKDIRKKYNIEIDDLIRVSAEVALSRMTDVIEIVDGEVRLKVDGDLNQLDGISFSKSESSSENKSGSTSTKTLSISAKRPDRVKGVQELGKLIGAYGDNPDDKEAKASAAKRLFDSLAKFKDKKKKD